MNRPILLYFQNKENRDRKYKELKKQGYNIRKSSSRNQLLRPEYIEDYPYPIPKNQLGFGNTIYKTKFATIYKIEEKI